MFIPKPIEDSDYFPIPTPTHRFYVMASDPLPDRLSAEADIQARRMLATFKPALAIEGLRYCSRHKSETTGRRALRSRWARQNNAEFRTPGMWRRNFYLFEFDKVRNLRQMIAAFS
jgi:hypothetical protein